MAAGLGFKTFNTGDVLSAADVNGYLMQGVWVFANATARTAAVTSPQEGNVSYLSDTNSLEIYDGTAWVAYGAGDITGVTAGTGISGGGTSGTVTITNSMATAIDAKGDLVAGTGADAFSRLAVGTNGQVLTADSSTATGLRWGAPASGLVLIGTTTFTTASTVNVNNVFTSTYQNYKVIYTATGSGGDAAVLMRMRVSGADNTTSNYTMQRFSAYGGTAAPERTNSPTQWVGGNVNSTTLNATEMTIFRPQETASTAVHLHNVMGAGGGDITLFQSYQAFAATTSFDGFSIYPGSGTMSGTLRVYGLANS